MSYLVTFTCLSCGTTKTVRCGTPENRHFCNNTCQNQHRQQQLIAQWLTTGEAYAGTRKNHYIKRYLLNEQSHQCAICRAADVWNGQPLTFILDHVNGDATNNTRDNLRLVCPNCNSQLPTFGSRNRGKGRRWRRERYQKVTA